MQNKGKKFFSIFITILIIAVLALVGYLTYYYVSNYLILKEAEEAVENFEQEVKAIAVEIQDIEEQPLEQVPNKEPTQTSINRNKTYSSRYRGYDIVGTIQIPKTKVKAPIVDKVTPSSISAAVGILYGTGLNEVGNTVLVAHNYRNGTFFSNNKKLVIGDKIYITDAMGRKIEYTIYNTYITSDSDFTYATRDTQGKKEISMSTCTTDVSKRLVIWAREN